MAFLLKVLTAGIVNVETGKLIIKDPLTGTGNMLKQAKDAIFNDFDEGVWIGKRVLESNGIGFSSYLTQNFNLNYLHYAVRIDGKTWHLCQVNGSTKKGIKFSGDDTKIYIGRCYESKDDYEWFYKGKTDRVNYTIQKLIEKINKQFLDYHAFLKNCIDVAKSLYLYARGLIQQSDVICLLFPKNIAEAILKKLFGFVPGSKLSLEIMNTIMP